MSGTKASKLVQAVVDRIVNSVVVIIRRPAAAPLKAANLHIKAHGTCLVEGAAGHCGRVPNGSKKLLLSNCHVMLI